METKIDKMADRLDSKLDKIHDRLNNIEIATVQNTSSLTEHMRRTDIAEERLEVLESEIKPVLDGMSFLKIIAKIGTYIGGIIYGIIKIFN